MHLLYKLVTQLVAQCFVLKLAMLQALTLTGNFCLELCLFADSVRLEWSLSSAKWCMHGTVSLDASKHIRCKEVRFADCQNTHFANTCFGST